MRFAVKWDRYIRSRNILNDLSNKVFIPNKTEDLNLRVFNIIARLNESKTLTNHISCEYKCKFDGPKCNSNQSWNKNKCWCDFKNIACVEKIMFRILLHVIVKMENI